MSFLETNPLAESCVRFMQQNQYRVVAVESCTGGLVASLLVSVPLCAQVLYGSMVVYNPHAKAEWVGISKDMLLARGAEDEQVAQRMALNALDRAALANVSVATTGFADGDKGGLVYFGFGLRTTDGVTTVTESKQFEGTRNQVRYAAAVYAITKLQKLCETNLASVNNIVREQNL